jgi:pilus assembly protein CpaC
MMAGGCARGGRWLWSWTLQLAALFFVGNAVELARAADAPPLPQRLLLYVGETRTLSAAPVRMAVGNGRVLSVNVVDSRQLLLLGESPGSSVLQLWFRDGTEQRIVIDVSAINLDALRDEVAMLLDGVTGVATRIAAGRIVLEGEGLAAAARARVAAVAALYPNQVIDFTGRLGADLTIQIDARIIEIRQGSLRDLGVRWRNEVNGPNAGIIADLAVNGLFRPGVSDAPRGAESVPPGARVWPPQGYLGWSAVLDSRLALLEQQGLLTVLAEPSLSCRSGGAARFVSGGEFPIPVVGGNGSADVEFKEYGVILDIKPVVDASGVIFAHVETELSQIDPSQTVLGVPGLLKRRSATDVTLREGETLVIAGLVSKLDAADRRSVPGLGRVPLAGRAFRADQRRTERSELVILLTPRIVSPWRSADAQAHAFDQDATEALERRARGSSELAP